MGIVEIRVWAAGFVFGRLGFRMSRLYFKEMACTEAGRKAGSQGGRKAMFYFPIEMKAIYPQNPPGQLKPSPLPAWASSVALAAREQGLH